MGSAFDAATRSHLSALKHAPRPLCASTVQAGNSSDQYGIERLPSPRHRRVYLSKSVHPLCGADSRPTKAFGDFASAFFIRAWIGRSGRISGSGTTLCQREQLTHRVGSLHRRVGRQLKYLAAGTIVLPSFIIDSVDRPTYEIIFGRST